MENSKIYPDLPEGSSVKEPEVAYLHNVADKGDILYISDHELETCCMTLAESKRLLFERIHKDFHL